eukprot:1915341-Amphidinium_carterae.1
MIANGKCLGIEEPAVDLFHCSKVRRASCTLKPLNVFASVGKRCICIITRMQRPACLKRTCVTIACVNLGAQDSIERGYLRARQVSKMLMGANIDQLMDLTRPEAIEPPLQSGRPHVVHV